MAALSLQTFSGLVQTASAAVQASARQLVDLSPGSVLRAVQEASASVGLWMQWLILQVLRMTRAATSAGADLDSWVADFGLTRLPAVAATGNVTFSRFTTGIATLIPVGAQAKTSDGTRVYAVTADTANGAWSVAQNGYLVGTSTASITVPVQDITTGSSGTLSVGTPGNVLANTITLLAGPGIPGIDTVTNASPFTNGIDVESDGALRTRFTAYIQTRSRGTLAAVGYAVMSVQQGVNFTIQENVNTGGAAEMGNFVVTIDDGSGAPSADLISRVSDAIAQYRPVGTTWNVQGPTDTTANVALTITVQSPGVKADLLAPVANAVAAYINGLAIGQRLAYTRIAAIAYATDPSIIDVTAVTINSATSDITPNQSGAVKAGTVVVS